MRLLIVLICFSMPVLAMERDKIIHDCKISKKLSSKKSQKNKKPNDLEKKKKFGIPPRTVSFDNVSENVDQITSKKKSVGMPGRLYFSSDRNLASKGYSPILDEARKKRPDPSKKSRTKKRRIFSKKDKKPKINDFEFIEPLINQQVMNKLRSLDWDAEVKRAFLGSGVNYSRRVCIPAPFLLDAFASAYIEGDYSVLDPYKKDEDARAQLFYIELMFDQLYLEQLRIYNKILTDMFKKQPQRRYDLLKYLVGDLDLKE